MIPSLRVNKNLFASHADIKFWIGTICQVDPSIHSKKAAARQPLQLGDLDVIALERDVRVKLEIGGTVSVLA